MLTLPNGDSPAWVRGLWAQSPGIREREETVEGHGGVTTDTSQEAFERSLALPILVWYQCSAMWTEKLSRGKSVKSFSQVKHGNISFLLTQESGSHLCEVALSFSREPPAIRFSRVGRVKKRAYLVMNREKCQICGFWNLPNEMSVLTLYCAACHCLLTKKMFTLLVVLAKRNSLSCWSIELQWVSEGLVMGEPGLCLETAVIFLFRQGWWLRLARSGSLAFALL